MRLVPNPRCCTKPYTKDSRPAGNTLNTTTTKTIHPKHPKNQLLAHTTQSTLNRNTLQPRARGDGSRTAVTEVTCTSPTPGMCALRPAKSRAPYTYLPRRKQWRIYMPLVETLFKLMQASNVIVHVTTDSTGGGGKSGRKPAAFSLSSLAAWRDPYTLSVRGWLAGSAGGVTSSQRLASTYLSRRKVAGHTQVP